LNGKERVLAAIGHTEPDRAPITFDAEKEVYAALYDHLGLPTKEALFDRLQVDTWMVLPGNFMYSEAESLKAEKTALWGYRTRVTAYSGGTYDEVCFNPLAGKDELSDIDAHTWPSPDTLDFSHFSTEAAAHADRAVIGVFTWGAYFVASFVRGLEDLMMDFALRPKYAHHLIDTIHGISSQSLHDMLDAHGDGIDIVYMADDYCSHLAPLFSPAQFREFVMPYLTEVVDITHRYGKKFLLHVCGAVRPLLPMIVEAGVDMLEPIQTRVSDVNCFSGLATIRSPGGWCGVGFGVEVEGLG